MGLEQGFLAVFPGRVDLFGSVDYMICNMIILYILSNITTNFRHTSNPPIKNDYVIGIF